MISIDLFTRPKTDTKYQQALMFAINLPLNLEKDSEYYLSYKGISDTAKLIDKMDPWKVDEFLRFVNLVGMLKYEENLARPRPDEEIYCTNSHADCWAKTDKMYCVTVGDRMVNFSLCGHCADNITENFRELGWNAVKREHSTLVDRQYRFLDPDECPLENNRI